MNFLYYQGIISKILHFNFRKKYTKETIKTKHPLGAF